jgi:hypothetical protein
MVKWLISGALCGGHEESWKGSALSVLQRWDSHIPSLQPTQDWVAVDA